LRRAAVPNKLSLIDHLRIERLVWTLDQQLYDLPHATRVAKRREVRDNLRDAARDVGVGEALRRLGGSRRLAEEFLAAEYGPGPRHSWLAAGYFASLVPMLVLYAFGEAANAFERGVLAHDPHATGTFTWDGIALFQHAVTFTFTDGHAEHVGGSWTPLTYILWLAGTVLVGRLWRLLPWYRRRRADAAV
jgi:hypothetical protein